MRVCCEFHPMWAPIFCDTVEPVYSGHCVTQPPVYTSRKFLSESVVMYIWYSTSLKAVIYSYLSKTSRNFSPFNDDCSSHVPLYFCIDRFHECCFLCHHAWVTLIRNICPMVDYDTAHACLTFCRGLLIYEYCKYYTLLQYNFLIYSHCIVFIY